MATLAVTSPVFWYTTRASGVVALVLLTGTVVLGLITSTRAGSQGWPRFAVSDLHRRIALLAMIFVIIHVVTTVMDTFVPIGPLAAVVPFASSYKTLWVTLGTVSVDLMVAIVVTSLLRGRLSARTWRTVHWASYLSWPIAVAHGVGMGTDARFGWVQLLVAACCISVLAALVWRVLARPVRVGAGTAASSPHAVEMARQGRVDPRHSTARVP